MTEKQTKILGVRLDLDTYETLRKLADRDGLDMSTWVRYHIKPIIENANKES